jgi:hypothetical protein
MHIEWIDILRSLAGLVAGGLIGVGFGLIQKLALHRNQRRQQAGDLNSGWAVMPGSMRRVAGLLVALVVVQIFCPLLFTDGVQWWVSGGIVAGYGAMLFRQLRLRRSQWLV